MITLYTWTTPHGEKPVILLEELSVDYDLALIDISAGEQDADTFRRLNPNGKIPALEDDGVTYFESGAILLHLAEKHGRFLPANAQVRADALAWTFWQVGGLGPMIGQWGHFLMAKEPQPLAQERYLIETLRLLNVMEKHLSQRPYLAGEGYSIADMMCFPWVKGGLGFLEAKAAERLNDLPNLRRWMATIAKRPAVERAIARLAEAAG